MLLLRHNSLPADDLFLIERKMLKVLDDFRPSHTILETSGLDAPRVEMYGLVLGIVERMGMRSALGISASEFLDFLIDIDKGYYPNPYHSFYHAVDVTLVLYHLLLNCEVAHCLTSVEATALMIAALCHDIGHPGKNNTFEISRGSSLAQKYHNLSVLESHSCHMTMVLLTKHNLLRKVQEQSLKAGSPATEMDVRRFITKAILATDMACHYNLQSNLTDLVAMNSTGDHTHASFNVFAAPDGPLAHFENEYYFCATPDTTVLLTLDQQPTQISVQKHSLPLSRDQRETLCQALLHAADISNAVRPWPVCKRWSDLVCDEFFEQGKAERLAGLPVSPNMDQDISIQSAISIQFSDFIVRPYFEAFAALFPKANGFLHVLQENRELWTLEEKREREALAQPQNDRALTVATAEVLLSEDGSSGNSSPSCSSVISNSHVSVAAGTVLIRSLYASSLNRPFLAMRSASHNRLDGALGVYNRNADESDSLSKVFEDRERRKSDQASFIYVRRHQKLDASPSLKDEEHAWISSN